MFEKSGAKKIRSKAESQQIATYAAGGERESSVDVCRAGGSTLPNACRLESDLHTRMSAAPRRSPGGGRGVHACGTPRIISDKDKLDVAAFVMCM